MLTFQELPAQVSDADGRSTPIDVSRARVPGGWLVRLGWREVAGTFVPDPTHSWDGRSLAATPR